MRLLTGLLVAVVLSGAQWAQSESVDYDGRFAFTRIRYRSDWGRSGGSWARDYPRADIHLPRIVAELTTMPLHVEASNVYDHEDPAIFHNPSVQARCELPRVCHDPLTIILA